MRAVLPFLALSLAAACTHGSATPAASGGAGPSSATAPSPPFLCRPDVPTDPCRSADLASTAIAPDGARTALAHVPAARPRVDCFYVYPTVDLSLVPGNHRSLEPTPQIEATTLAQAARFTETCTLWVPLYRQVTIGTYFRPKAILEEHLAIAYGDVERAFADFLAHTDPSRPIVLIGHSQGAEMIVRLLRRYFDADPAMRARLLLAMPIGGWFEVPAGQTRGGTLANVPICTRPLETGCVVAYHTYAAGEPVEAGRWRPAAGRETACVDPHTLDAPSSPRLAGALFTLWPDYRRFMRGVTGVSTPFVELGGFYSARCVRGPEGYAWLEVADDPPPGDLRASPVDLRDRRFQLGNLGLHVLDMQLAQRDLVALVKRRAATLSPHEPASQ